MNLIKDIKEGKNVDKLLSSVMSNIYTHGPVSTVEMEILSYISIFQPDKIENQIDNILLFLGVFFKQTRLPTTLKGFAQSLYKDFIIESFKSKYTPLQAHILYETQQNRVFSFSAPTSTGKSYVLFELIKQCEHDVVAVVPSRALINEYYLRLCNEIVDKSINILTHIDKINTAHCRRNIFIVTPERCRELFKFKDLLQIDFILFDEAQLTDEKGKRGLYFDVIVRRCNKEFPNAKILFAHPFIDNPEAQLKKNGIEEKSSSIKYEQKNVSQIYICDNGDDTFSYFGSDDKKFGIGKVECGAYDPIEKCIKEEGSVLFYVSKNSIITGSFAITFKKYISLCSNIDTKEVTDFIKQLSLFTGGSPVKSMNYYSKMLTLLRKGIVIHHGSLPLKARILMEKFTRAHHCRICFATSTLEQGINMPFDIVYIDRLESSKVLSVKNLIGRAGRSTNFRKIDYGIVIVAKSKVSRLRSLLHSPVVMKEISQIDNDEQLSDEYNEFKRAIINNTFSDQFNLTQSQVDHLSTGDLDVFLFSIIGVFFNERDGGQKMKIDREIFKILIDSFVFIYENYLERELLDGEKHVLCTAVSILIWRIQGHTFSNICHLRYAYISRQNERTKVESQSLITESLFARPTQKCKDLPNNQQQFFIPLFSKGTKVEDVDYDIVTYDTYDYLDKIIDLYLSDIFYAAFMKLYERCPEQKILQMANLIKYGTYNPRYIWMLRYGMSFEDIQELDAYISDINQEEIMVNDSFWELSEMQRASIERFVLK